MSPEPPKPAPPPAKRPLEDIRAKDRFPPLPPPGNRATEMVELAKVDVDSPSDCELDVLGEEVVLGEGFQFDLKEGAISQGSLFYFVDGWRFDGKH